MLVVAALTWPGPRTVVDQLTGSTRTEEGRPGASAAGLAALEHALRIGESLGGKVVAVTIGPSAAEEMLREAVAAGAGGALRVDADPTDDEAVARALLAAVAERHGTPDVVVFGDDSGDVPGFLAAITDTAQALGLLELTVEQGVLNGLRRLDKGRRERLAIPMPAVCSVEPVLRPRRAGLPAMLAARNTTIPVVKPVVPGWTVRAGTIRAYRPRARILPIPAADQARDRIVALTNAVSAGGSATVVTPPDAAAAADLLLDYLSRHGYLGDTT
ncbi:mycofactocin-associated electron transfer flavoprotein beta subunit [Kutzneria sp. 744]|uniref:mycofactocin-associated electron transfer flavoprotein beta subunit n=1 Tax=Kutzneria sp. (strain 744) TaxID=345341 RepID=UPI0003EEA787|nr:mycofactocin-associated electron transfer flavoprotein beta subunit [Kutzneria sp. 744]EWM17483.1 electron transfer flavoprotein, beta subunit [Kutzneria sp. 744]